jgi:hypothetical protein
VYNNKENVTEMVKTKRHVERILHEQAMNQSMGAANTSFKDQMALERGEKSPSTPQERRASQKLNNSDLKLLRPRRSSLYRGDGAADEFSQALHSRLNRDQERHDRGLMKFGDTPSSKEYHKYLRELVNSDEIDEKVTKIQQRLVEDHGIYPSHRMDAYMLDDDAIFPEWVQNLPWNVRDQVKYGRMGLTEEDEALRVRLGRLSMDKRIQEWKRLQRAKEYLAAKQEMLSPSELRDARLAKRRFHALRRKRLRRAAVMRHLARRKPDEFEAYPSGAVDYSRRLAVIAQHVENGVPTHGQWPLDRELLTKAKISRMQENAGRTFLKTPEEEKMLKSGCINETMSKMIERLDEKEKPFKRIGRRQYANRVNAIKHGDQDEYGHKYRRLKSRIFRREEAHRSIEEIALEKELKYEPKPYTSGKKHRAGDQWSQHLQEHSYSRGLPSIRYGS